MFHTATVDEGTAAAEFGVVAPVARAESGPGLAKAVALLNGPADKRAKLYALHLIEPETREHLGMTLAAARPATDVVLRPILETASELGLPSEPVSFHTRDIASDIARVARAKRADLILMGAHQALLGKTVLGGTVHRVLTGADTDVAILVDRGLPDKPRILVPFQGSVHDRLALDLARRIGGRSGAGVTVLRVTGAGRAADAPGRTDGEKQTPNGLVEWTVEGASPIDAVLGHAGEFDLVVVGVGEEWGLMSHLFGFRTERMAREWPGSLLLVRKHQPVAELHPPSATPKPAQAPATVSHG
jgi:nucleotide-binding universal stress UspA family protein